MRVKLVTLVLALMTAVTVNAQKNKEKDLAIDKPALVGKWTLVGTDLGGGFITADSAGFFKATLVIYENDSYEIKHEESTEKGTYAIEGIYLVLTDSSTKAITKAHAAKDNMLSLVDYDEDESAIFIYFKKNKK